MYFNSIRRNIFIVFVLIAMIGCNSSDEPECIKCDTAPMVAKSDLEYLGLTVPFSIQKMQDDPPIYTLGLMPHARIFSFEEDVLNQALYDITPDGRKVNDQYGSQFLELLKKSEQDDIPAKLYILPETTEVWWVEEATEGELIDYFEATRQPKGKIAK